MDAAALVWRIVLGSAGAVALVAAATQHGFTAAHALLAVAAFIVAAMSGYLVFAGLWRRDARLKVSGAEIHAPASGTAQWSGVIGSVIGIAFGALIPGVILALIGGFLIGAASAPQNPRLSA